jgi:acyl-coenzyme A synthetase/AMP-(fatty) acid ligase
MALIHAIEAHARATPDKPAIVFNGAPVSYAAFADRTAAARGALAREGAGPGGEAILCIHHGLDNWLLGLALRGLGVNTVAARSANEIEGLAAGRPVLVVTTDGERAHWPGLSEAAARTGGRLIVISADSLKDGARAAPPAAPDPGGYVLLTSGTTGVYKKVLQDAAAEADLVALNTRRAGIAADTVFNVADFGPWTGAGYTWPTLVWHAGGTVVAKLGRPRERPFADGPRLTHAVVTPAMLDELLAAPANAYPRNDGLVLLTVGGLVSRAQWEGACARLTGDMRCLYGATETCHILYTPIRSAEDLRWNQVHDGVMQVVDEADRPVAAGEAGFVRLRASRGAAGYLDDAETSRAFFRDGWFYPGDLGVVDAAGRIALQGRVTDVINLGGSKYPTTPIETALQERLGVKAVCVFSAPTADGEAVHVAIEPGAALVTAGALKAALEAAMPPMRTQVRVHKVEALPRNHMGKVDRAALKRQLVDGAPGPT